MRSCLFFGGSLELHGLADLEESHIFLESLLKMKLIIGKLLVEFKDQRGIIVLVFWEFSLDSTGLRYAYKAGSLHLYEYLSKGNKK